MENTVTEFWQMVWEQRCTAIVMLAGLTDKTGQVRNTYGSCFSSHFFSCLLHFLRALLLKGARKNSYYLLGKTFNVRTLSTWCQSSQIWRTQNNNFNLLRIRTYCFFLHIQLHSDLLQEISVLGTKIVKVKPVVRVFTSFLPSVIINLWVESCCIEYWMQW